MHDLVERAQGCLLGALIGDAAGATLEFLGRAPGPADLDRALAMSGGGVLGVAPGQITDDGELTLALARALVQDQAQPYPREVVAQAYRAWMDSHPFDVGQATGSALRAQATAGGSLADAMAFAAQAHNHASKANGALMRATPLGIRAAGQTLQQAVQAARLDAALTHPHPSCQWAGAAYAVAIGHLLRQAGDADGAVAQARAVLEGGREAGADEVLAWLDDAVAGTLPACTPLMGFVRIGFTHAFHHLLAGHSHAAALRAVLAGGGDTDTNACIVGGLVGARVGLQGLDARQVTAVTGCDTNRGRPRPAWLGAADALALAAALATSR